MYVCVHLTVTYCMSDVIFYNPVVSTCLQTRQSCDMFLSLKSFVFKCNSIEGSTTYVYHPKHGIYIRLTRRKT